MTVWEQKGFVVVATKQGYPQVLSFHVTKWEADIAAEKERRLLKDAGFEVSILPSEVTFEAADAVDT